MAERANRGGHGPRSVASAVTRLIGQLGYSETTARRELEEVWADVVGPQRADCTRVGSLRRGELEILVDDAPLLQELVGFEEQRLLRAVQGRLRHNRVRRLRFRRS